MPEYKPGDWLAICDSCGFKYYASQLRKRPHDGMMVCEKDWESEHPQDFLRPKQERPAPPWTRPDRDGSDAHDVTYVELPESETFIPDNTFDEQE